MEIALRLFPPCFGKDYYIYHPIRGYMMAPNYYRENNGIEYRTNSSGLRDKEYCPKSSKYRIVVFGDSITFGYGVNLAESFPKKLEVLLNRGFSGKFEIINCGIMGYDTKSEFLLLRELKTKYSPDMVILMYTLNDIFSHPESGLLKLPQQGIRLLQKIHNSSYFVQYLRSRIKRFGRLHSIASIEKTYSQNSKLWQDNQDWIRKIRSLCKEDDIKLIFCIFPYPAYGKDSNTIKDVCLTVEKFINSENILSLNLSPTLIELNKRGLLTLGEDPHPNSMCHALIADVIYSFMKNGIFCSSSAFEERHAAVLNN